MSHPTPNISEPEIILETVKNKTKATLSVTACFGDTSAFSLLSPPQQQLSEVLEIGALLFPIAVYWRRRNNDGRKREERVHHSPFW